MKVSAQLSAGNFLVSRFFPLLREREDAEDRWVRTQRRQQDILKHQLQFHSIVIRKILMFLRPLMLVFDDSPFSEDWWLVMAV
ncbi:MAG: hypothetical protein JWO03_773 [Bacteroidetes bacterium]|nr:hypothetical protein [Bacteroidota bacterium]